MKQSGVQAFAKGHERAGIFQFSTFNFQLKAGTHENSPTPTQL